MARGCYGRNQITRGNAQGAPQVSGEWFHSVEDRQRALEQITAGFQALQTEILNWQGHADPQRARAFGQWLEVDVAPALAAWNAFADREQKSWLAKAVTSWQTFVAWRERLRNLRQLARAHGIVLESPEPPLLPTTIWEKSDLGTGNELAPLVGASKIAFRSVLTVIGVITVYTLARDARNWTRIRSLKHGKDT